ncbi:MAG: hypothetical protein NVSMB49_21000 [Ktedonobacteraceae bacterium]
MSQNNIAGEDIPTLALTPIPQRRAIEIPDAPPVVLQTLDIARHIATAPNGKRYVVATYDDSLLGRDFVTAVYPQQNDYLTLVRLTVCEFISNTIDQATQRHIASVQAIQQGKIDELKDAAKK